MNDELRYAIDALQGGQGDISNSFRKAMSSITHVIEKRIGTPLDKTPKDGFPN